MGGLKKLTSVKKLLTVAYETLQQYDAEERHGNSCSAINDAISSIEEAIAFIDTEEAAEEYEHESV